VLLPPLRLDPRVLLDLQPPLLEVPLPHHQAYLLDHPGDRLVPTGPHIKRILDILRMVVRTLPTLAALPAQQAAVRPHPVALVLLQMDQDTLDLLPIGPWGTQEGHQGDHPEVPKEDHRAH